MQVHIELTKWSFYRALIAEFIATLHSFTLWCWQSSTVRARLSRMTHVGVLAFKALLGLLVAWSLSLFTTLPVFLDNKLTRRWSLGYSWLIRCHWSEQFYAWWLSVLEPFAVWVSSKPSNLLTIIAMGRCQRAHHQLQ